MASTGLTGKKFIGKVVEGFDVENRGRYYVHIPDLMPHMPESKGMICTNSIHPTRSANGARGTYGTYTPLHVGTTVEVECQTDDMNGARVVSIVSDDQPNSNMSPGKMMGVEPSGKIIQLIVNGLPDDPFDPNTVLSNVEKLINQGTAEGLKLLSPVLGLVNNLGNFADGLKNMFKDVVSQIPGGDLLPLNDVAKLIPENFSSRQSRSGFMDLIPPIPNAEAFLQVPFDLNSLSLDVFDINAAKERFNDLKEAASKFLSDKMPMSDVMGAITDGAMKAADNVMTSAKGQLANIVDSAKYPAALENMRNLKVSQLMSPMPGFSRSSLPNFSDLMPDQQQMIDISLGVLNKTKFLNHMAAEFYKTGSMFGGSLFGRSKNRAKNRSGASLFETANMCIPGGFAHYDYGLGTVIPDIKERDEIYTFGMCPGQSGMYVNEDTKNDPESMNVIYANKASAVRMDPTGVHLSTIQNYRQKIGINREIETDGASYITIRGGNYMIYVENGNVGIRSKKNIALYAEEGDISLTAKKSIRMFALEGDIVMRAEQKNIFAKAKTVINMQAEDKQIAMEAKNSSVLLKCKNGIGMESTGGDSSMSISGGDLNIDADNINLNCGKSVQLGLGCEVGKAVVPTFVGKPVVTL